MGGIAIAIALSQVSLQGGIVVLEGCVPTIQAFIVRNLYTVGGIAIAIALSQVLAGIGVLEGCIPTIQAFIERNLYTVGGIAIAIALSQVSYRGDWSTRGLCTHHSGLHREEPLHGGGHRHRHRS